MKNLINEDIVNGLKSAYQLNESTIDGDEIISLIKIADRYSIKAIDKLINLLSPINEKVISSTLIGEIIRAYNYLRYQFKHNGLLPDSEETTDNKDELETVKSCAYFISALAEVGDKFSLIINKYKPSLEDISKYIQKNDLEDMFGDVLNLAADRYLIIIDPYSKKLIGNSYDCKEFSKYMTYSIDSSDEEMLNPKNEEETDELAKKYL